jgi:hypothetical protein
MKTLRTETITSIWDYFDKYGHGDGDYDTAGWHYMEDYKRALQTALDKSGLDFKFEVIDYEVDTLHNRCRLGIRANGVLLDVVADSMDSQVIETGNNSIDNFLLQQIFEAAEASME